jgi:Mn2+/Fe2+ NRAMP family transporter
MPLNRDAMLVAVATVGTTLAPWGLAFIQSYAVDKRLRPGDLGYERADVVVGALLTGLIGAFVVIACAATLHRTGVEIDDASDAALALEPLAGTYAAKLFGLGFLGAALLAAAVVPLSTAYSVAEALGRRADLDDSFDQARTFYSSYGVVVLISASVVLVPGAPLIPILFLSQAVNAVLLLVLLPFMRALANDERVMGSQKLGAVGRAVTGIAMAGIAASILALAVLLVT